MYKIQFLKTISILLLLTFSNLLVFVIFKGEGKNSAGVGYENRKVEFRGGNEPIVFANEGDVDTSNQDLLNKIESLPDNTWLKLPPHKVVGDMGVLNNDPDYKRLGPRVRDYCNKMVYAPERKRALYTGGGHNIHPWNDVWEYDLATNTWICLYGADPLPKKTDDHIEWFKANTKIKDGAITTLRGAPIRPCHTWWSFCYDPDKKRMLFLESHNGVVWLNKEAMAKAHNLEANDKMFATYGSGPGESVLFTFYPETKEWKEIYVKVPKARESSLLEYIPESKTIWWTSGNTFLLKEESKEWLPQTKGGAGGGGETAYDPESRKIVASVGFQTWVYDCNTNIWTLVEKDAPYGVIVPNGTFCYDSFAKKFICYSNMVNGQKDALFRISIYDLKENKWSMPEAQGDCPKVGNITGYYDVARNVTVIYSGAEIWVYRCKK